MSNIIDIISNIDPTNIFTIMPFVIIALTLSPRLLYMFKPSWEVIILGKKAQNTQYIATVIFLYLVMLLYNFSPIFIADSNYIKFLAGAILILFILLLISLSFCFYFMRKGLEPQNKFTIFFVKKYPLFLFLIAFLLCTVAISQLDETNTNGFLYTIILLVSLAELFFTCLILEVYMPSKRHVKIHYYVDPKSIPEEGLYILSSEHDELLYVEIIHLI